MPNNDLFPKDIILLAQHSERTYGVPACLTLAQFCVESDYGAKTAGSFNYFGIKWHDACGYPANSIFTHEFEDGKSILVRADFINFPNAQAAFDYHAKLLVNPHGPYAGCLTKIHGWRAYTTCIAGVYATSPTYAQTLLGIIDRYHLFDWDLPQPK